MAAHWFAKIYLNFSIFCIYSPWTCLCICSKFSPCLHMLLLRRNKHWQKMDGWMETNCCAFFLLSSLALSGLQKGSILWSPYTAIKVNTMKRNTQNLILYTGRVHPRNRHLWRTHLVTLQVWCITWWTCMHAIYIDKVVTNIHTHIDNTNMLGCNLIPLHICLHMHSYCMCTQCWFRPHRWGALANQLTWISAPVNPHPVSSF